MALNTDSGSDSSLCAFLRVEAATATSIGNLRRQSRQAFSGPVTSVVSSMYQATSKVSQALMVSTRAKSDR